MDSTTHPFVIDADAEGSTAETARLLIGTAVEYGLDSSTAVQRITRPAAGFRITEDLADALGDEDETLLTERRQAGLASEAGVQEAQGDDLPPSEPFGEPGTQVADATSAGVDYGTWDYADLKAAVKNRGIEVEDQKSDTLIAALQAADEADAADQSGAE